MPVFQSIISLTECGWTVHLNVAGQLSLSPYRTGPTYKKAEVPASGTPFVQLVVLTRTYLVTTLFFRGRLLPPNFDVR